MLADREIRGHTLLQTSDPPASIPPRYTAWQVSPLLTQPLASCPRCAARKLILGAPPALISALAPLHQLSLWLPSDCAQCRTNAGWRSSTEAVCTSHNCLDRGTSVCDLQGRSIPSGNRLPSAHLCPWEEWL